jgi:hypothetical protein
MRKLLLLIATLASSLGASATSACSRPNPANRPVVEDTVRVVEVSRKLHNVPLDSLENELSRYSYFWIDRRWTITVMERNLHRPERDLRTSVTDGLSNEQVSDLFAAMMFSPLVMRDSALVNDDWKHQLSAMNMALDALTRDRSSSLVLQLDRQETNDLLRGLEHTSNVMLDSARTYWNLATEVHYCRQEGNRCQIRFK